MTQVVFGISYIAVIMLVFVVFALIVGGRILGALAGGLGRMLGLIPPRPRMMMPPPMRKPVQQMAPGLAHLPMIWPDKYIQCRVPGCRHANPANARFCRHCGHAFPVPYARSSHRTENYM